jgi:hypothetical protein
MLAQEAAMFPVTHFWPRLTRALVPALLSGALLFVAAPIAAAQAEACDLTGEPGTSPIDARKSRVLITVLHDASGPLDQVVDLQLTITFVENRAHGTDLERVSGTVVIPAADPPAVLVATGEVEVGCAGGDITGLTVPVKFPSGGDGVVFFAVTGPNQPIPGSRLYVGNLTFMGGDTTLVMPGVAIVVTVLGPSHATTSDERTEVAAASVTRPGTKHQAKDQPREERRSKGGNAGKGEHGKHGKGRKK